MLAELLAVALLAGIVGLDVVGFPQAMFSRPIVGATLAGWLFGAPIAGLACGAALECLALEALPVGASRYPEWGSASVVAGAVSAIGAGGLQLPNAGVFVVAVAVGIACAWLGGWTLTKTRQLVGWYARSQPEQISSGDRSAVIGIQLFGLTVDLARGATLGFVTYIPASALAVWCSSNWALPAPESRAIVVACVAAVAASAVWKDFHSISGTRRLFLLSLTLGTVLVALGA